MLKIPLQQFVSKIKWNHLKKKLLLKTMVRHSSLSVLNVAEKNDAAKRISELLSNRQLTRVCLYVKLLD